MEPMGYEQLNSAHLDATFAALSDPTRRAILARLAAGEASVNELAEPFAMTQPAISKHLKVLERAGLISRGRDAQRRPRRLEAKPLAQATGWLENYRQFWEGRFQKLDALLDEMKAWEKDKSVRGGLSAAGATTGRAGASRTGKSPRRTRKRKGTRQ
jgi:DNA-binding transcriptional ArsR family regulator